MQTTVVDTPILDGKWVRLEPLSRNHLSGLEEIAFEEKIWRYMLTRVSNRSELEGWMESALAANGNGHIVWATILKAENRIVGSTRLIELDMRHRTAEIGHTWISPRWHGASVNPEAKQLQLRYAFEELGLNRVAFKTHHENLQSQAAVRKLGAVYEGTFRNHNVMPDGSLRHSVWFSITREEWPQVRSRLEERLRVDQPSS
ncbi:MAG TPA: GNAT family protein [Edaphobacter sp.]|jgi:RimJ/RimL family protein N-acetyltransferase|nr:GNAT family protein [Edaphobacter sp.]